MTPQTRLVLGSVAFAVLWALVMILWTGTDRTNVIIVCIAGAVAGVLWYLGMRLFSKWQAERESLRAGPPDQR